MKYSSIRDLFDSWNRPSGAQLVPECDGSASKPRVKSPNHGADGGPGASPKRLAPALLFQRAAKRSFDIIVAIIGLILLSPILLLSSLAIILNSRGPIVCRQVRHGYGNVTFRVFKFRSTTTQNIDGAIHAARKDACVTGIGRILRSSGIDELPQLINVLRGEMSIVGPEPFLAAPGPIAEEQLSLYSQQHKMKPGVTGWAQINGYWGETNIREAIQRRIKYDLYYIENWTFLLDMKIIWMTLCSRKAYLPTK